MSEQASLSAEDQQWRRLVADWVQLACQREVQSPKPGNVSPGLNFTDATVADFLASADAIAPVMARASGQALGATVLECVERTRKVVQHNTNLGIILLIAPLAAVPNGKTLKSGIRDVLNRTTVADSVAVYEAIRRAHPAGLGEVEDQDVQQQPTQNLVECMRLASDRDLIAAQYVNDFPQVLDDGLKWFAEARQSIESPEGQITWLAVRFLAEFGDSLVARKCGQSMSDEVRDKASQLLTNGWPQEPGSENKLAEFDAFLRADGNRRNPGTTADFIAAILFAALREGHIT